MRFLSFFRESTIDMISDDTEDEVDADVSTPLDLPPEITLVLRNRDVKEGGSTQFSCSAISRAPITAEWYKEEQLLKNWPRFAQEQDDVRFMLNIKKAKTTDAGQFRFVARNDFGQVENNAYLNVERKFCGFGSVASVQYHSRFVFSVVFLAVIYFDLGNPLERKESLDLVFVFFLCFFLSCCCVRVRALESKCKCVCARTCVCACVRACVRAYVY